MTPTPEHQPSVRVTLDAIYEQGQTTAAKVTELEHTVSKMVAINERLDSHKQDIKNHGDRITELEKGQSGIKVIITLISAAITAAVVKVFAG